MTSFRAYRLHSSGGKIRAGFESLTLDDLTDGEVVIQVTHSGINYKDALAVTGKGKILRRPELNGGIDLAGAVFESSDSRFKKGDQVLVCGCGMSETIDGGYSQFARVPADCVVPLPVGMTAFDAMAIGTAGFTAALAIIRMEQNGQSPDRGPVVVTGATGGVGSIAIDILSGLGYDVTAFTGKNEQHDYLRTLGATSFIDRNAIEMGTKPLEKARWGCAVDNVGGNTLGWLTRTVKPWGNIASIGLVGGFTLETTVMPFILRGVSLLGINSIEMPTAVRNSAWQRLTNDLKPRHLDKIVTRVIPFEDLPKVFDDYFDAAFIGRTVIEITS